MIERAEFIAGDLAAAVSIASGVVRTRTTIPVLSCLLIEADRKAGVYVSGTDLDLHASAPCPASVDAASFRVCVSAFQLRRILAFVPKDTICSVERHIEDKAERVFLTFRGARFRLINSNPADFPAFTFNARKAAGPRLDPEAFLANLRAVERCISREETRYYLNGVCVYGFYDESRAENRLKLVATDGHRLAWAGLGEAEGTAPKSLPDGKGGDSRPILPRDFVGRLLADRRLKPHALNFDFDAMAVRAECAGGIQITAKLIDGSFPDVERVIPKSGLDQSRFEVDSRAFIAAVQRIDAAQSPTGDRSRSIRLDFTPKGLFLSAANVEVEGTGERVDCVKETAGALTIGFNGKYLVDLVKNIRRGEEGPLVFLLRDGASPAAFPGERVNSVLMPLRVDFDRPSVAAEDLSRELAE